MPGFLVVDDSPLVQETLAAILRRVFPSHSLFRAGNGSDGLALAEQEMPETILMDIRMPGMDGFEACRRLKDNPLTQRIPIVVMTGNRDEESSLAEGLELGADGYLYKPFLPQEVIAIVRVMLRLKQTEDALRNRKADLEATVQQQNQQLQASRDALQCKVVQLQATIERQTQELIHADRLAHAGIMAAGIAHEVNNPTTFIASNLETFRRYWEVVEAGIDANQACPAELAQRLAAVRAEMPDLLHGMQTGVKRIATIVSGMKSYTSKSAQQYRSVQVAELIATSRQLTASQTRQYLRIHSQLAPELPPVLGSSQLLSQVMINLILNAANAIGERGQAGNLWIDAGLDQRADQVLIQVRDDGPGIKPEHKAHIFDPFFTSRRSAGGTGLGLFICHGIIKGHGGTLTVESILGKGTCFTMRLPVFRHELKRANDAQPIQEAEAPA